MHELTDIKYWHPLADSAQVIGAWATAVAAVIAGLSLAAICVQMVWTARLARQDNLLEIHKEYLKMCFENPQFSSSDALRRHFGDRIFRKIAVDRTDIDTQKALWFLSCMLYTMEQIHLLSRRGFRTDPCWHSVVLTQLRYHRETLRLVWATSKPHYGADFARIVASVLDDG